MRQLNEAPKSYRSPCIFARVDAVALLHRFTMPRIIPATPAQLCPHRLRNGPTALQRIARLHPVVPFKSRDTVSERWHQQVRSTTTTSLSSLNQLLPVPLKRCGSGDSREVRWVMLFLSDGACAVLPGMKT